MLFGHIGLKPAPLLVGIGQFAKPVGEFDTAGIDFEPVGEARIACAQRGERCFGAGIFV